MDPSSSAPASPLSADTLQALSLSTEDAETSAQIDLVLEMTATFDADGFQLPSSVTRSEVKHALQACDGDVSRAVDDVFSLAAIRSLRQQERQTLSERRQQHATLQLSELCSGLGLDESSSFVAALQQLPAEERDALLASDGAFVQQLLLSLDEEEMEMEGGEDSEEEEEEDVHPLQYLLELYPDYKPEVVEDVLDSHGYDVNRAAEALHNLRALNHVQSYATVVNADARAAAQQRELFVNGPKVDSLGQFPELAYPMLPARRHVARGKVKTVNAWDQQHAPHDRQESGITTQLKLERLKKLLPSIDSNVIQTTFFLNGCSSDATEATLREVYNLPLVHKHAPPPTVTEEVEMAAAAADAEEEAATAAKNSRRSGRSSRAEDWTLVSSKIKVNAARAQLSDRYCAVLASFRRGQNILAVDRVRELSKARREHREAQREWAHDFFLGHEEHLKHQRPIDLHGMIVMEALWVAREAIEYCQAHRIRRCLLICGVGHHSINGKPRILTAIQLSLDRRQIDYRELHGVITVFPLRSTDSS
ncbi:hypothetical protein PHYSODRAFT_317710 [Phytophthora sojae]|uniref:Smr domain-containing protein n=1 Tax=Phytophthora sojae (strain P6497) TaxID=1094619 RepID=G5A094_PHYSP|nr:hypothetical protein PHYSODRAFT_317710 [Phytophthora sojae]EGZ10483.1 hypothetical protein PHYSODRAFT_317710 [Phytophthora sojae]|eukprot:XP_009533228.1 hypothetical protein PHYSODRAFT_317710 [Phytophthora sojae]